MVTVRKRLPADHILPADWEYLIEMARNNPEHLKKFISGNENAEANMAINVDYSGNKPLSVEEIAKIYNVDLDKYEAAYIKPNIWPVGAKFKHPDGRIEIITKTLYQSKVTFRPKPEWGLEEVRAILSEPATKVNLVHDESIDAGKTYAAEIDLFDFHLGKADVNGEWDLDYSAEIWNKAISSLLAQLPLSQIEKFVLPCGNDFLQVDNTKGLTYAGTPVGANVPYFKMHMFGKELFCKTIEFLLQYGDVVVPCVKGNHDHDSTFTLGEMIKERFKHDNLK